MRLFRGGLGTLLGAALSQGEVAVRRLGKLCEHFKTDPRGLLDWAKRDIMGFQDALEDFVSKLEAEGKSPGYIQGFLKTVKSWLRYNNISLTWRIKIKNSTATPTIENEKVPSQEELARILRVSPPRVKVAIAPNGVRRLKASKPG
jgi:hypothetical protein